MNEAQVPVEVQEQIAEFFYSIPQATHQAFCRHLAFIHFCLNSKDVDLEDLYMEDERRSRSRQVRHTKRDMDEENTGKDYNPYSLEQEMCQCIRNGSIAGLKELFASPHVALFSGKMAQSPVRHMKNVFYQSSHKCGYAGGYSRRPQRREGLSAD